MLLALSTATWTDIGPGSSTLTNGQVQAAITNGQIPGGGAISGRVTGIAADPTTAGVFYVASAGGGVWKTADGGADWTPLTENVVSGGTPVPMFMGAIAVAPSNNQVLYAGTGEANNSGDSNFGEGVLVSQNGGQSWALTAQVPLQGTAISRIAVDPQNPGTAYVAVSNNSVNGNAGAATGIYKLTGFGATVTNVTASNTTASGAAAPLDSVDPWSDVVIDPTTSGGGAVLFAAVGNPGGAAGNGVYSSTDGGAHWTTAAIGGGLVSGATVGRISLSIAHLSTPGSAAVLYASMSATGAGGTAQNLLGLFQSTNGGTAWTNITSNLKGDDYLQGGTPQGQGGYDNVVAVDPVNPNRVFVAGVLKNQGNALGFSGGGIEVSTDGGSTWSEINTDGNGNGPHTDYHALAFDASDQLLAGNDGGIFRLGSNNAWADLNTNLEITTFDGISLSSASSNIVFGGSQDNGTERYNGTPTWQRPGSNATSGDGATTIIDPNNPNRVYVLANKRLGQSTDGGATFRSINAGIATFSKAAGGNTNFVAPFAIDGAGDVLFGSDELNLCTNPTSSTPTWSQIGIPGTNNFNPGDIAINAVAVDPNDATNNTVYVSAGARLFVTRNAQAGTACTWTAIDGTVVGNGWPAGFVVGGAAATNSYGNPYSLMVPLGAAPGTAFAVGKSAVIATTNYGSSWTNITGAGLPANIPLDSIAAVPGFGVYVGTDVGVYFSNSITMTGATTTITAPVAWSRFQAGLPNAQVSDLVAAKYPDVGTVLAAGTHGRGVWEILLSPGAASPPITGFGAKVVTSETTNSDMGPALGTVNGITYMAWTGQNNNQIVVTPLHADGTPFEPPALISPATSHSSLSLATLNNQMYLAFTGRNGDHEIYITAVNINGGAVSLGPAIDMGQTSDNAPALGAFNGNLYLAWHGRGNDRLFIMEVNTGGGLSPGPVYGSVTLNGSPTLASAFGQFWVGFTGQTSDVFYAPVTINGADGSVSNVTGLIQLPEKSDYSPSLANLNGQLYMAWTAQGNPIIGANSQYLEVLQILPGGGFVEPHLSDTGNTSNNLPALGTNNGAPIIAWTGTDGDHRLNLEFLSTSVPGVVLTPQSLNLTGDVGGTNQSDVFVIDSQSGGVQVSAFSGGKGYTQSYAAGTVNTITIQPLGGHNTIVLNAVPQGVVVNIQTTGADFIDIGAGSLAGIQGSITLTGAGQAVVQVDDSRDSSASNATLNRGSLDFNGRSSLVSWSGLQHLAQLTYEGGAAADTINVLGTSAATTVVGGGRTNVIDVGLAAPGASGGSLASLFGPLTIAGGVGPGANNRLLISDAADANSDTVTATAAAGDGGVSGVGDGDGELAPNDGTFTFRSASLPSAGAVINYSGHFTDSGGAPDGIALWGAYAAFGSNVYNIQGTPFGDTIQVHGDGVSDTFNVSADAPANTGDLGDIRSTLSLIGGAGGANQLNVNDDATVRHTWEIVQANTGYIDNNHFINFAGIQDLAGGGDDDTFDFAPPGSVSGNIDGGGGSNTLDDSNLAGPIAVNLQTDTAPGIGGTFANIGRFIGSASGQDVLIGPDAGGDWALTTTNAGTINSSIYSSFEDLTGGRGTDRFVVFPGGSVFGNIEGGGGANTLDYSSLLGPVTVNVQTDTGPGIGGTFADIGNFVGSASGQDTLIGPDAGAVWNLTAGNGGSVNGLTYSSFEDLTGGAGTDRFVFFPGGGVSGNIDGGGGGNSLDYSNLPGPVTVNVQTDTGPGIGGTFADIGNFVGSASGQDTLIGPDAGAVWNLTGADAGTVNSFTYSSFEDLTGGGGADRFAFLSGGSVSGNIDGGGGNNTIDYFNISYDVTVNLQNSTTTNVGGIFCNIENFIGGNGVNTVIGPDTNAVWDLIGLDTFAVDGVNFSRFQNIVGGSGDDRFVIHTGGGVSGGIDGGGGNNTLDYSPYVGDITVDLGLGYATAIGQGVKHVENIIGSIGNDLLVGDALPNALIGGTGRNVIIGDAGADTIVGGGGDNILIGGSTIYDLNLLALTQIMEEWTRADLSFEQRLADLISDAPPARALNGPYRLNKKTVSDDDVADGLTGGGSLDWFFAGGGGTVQDRKPGDHITG